MQPVEVGICSEVDDSKVRTDLHNSQAHLVEIGQKAKLVFKDLCKVREQSVGSVKAVEKALCQVTEMSSRPQAFEVEIKSLKSQINVIARISEAAASSAYKIG